jgi:DNA-binding NarL/FixJ family response regulator
LSPREREVLSIALLGRTNKEIAFQLAIGHSTVRVLLTRAAKKLGAHDRYDLLRRFEALYAHDPDEASGTAASS